MIAPSPSSGPRFGVIAALAASLLLAACGSTVQQTGTGVAVGDGARGDELGLTGDASSSGADTVGGESAGSGAATAGGAGQPGGTRAGGVAGGTGAAAAVRPGGPIKVGIMYTEDTNEYAKTVGAALVEPDAREAAGAVLKHINANGGLAGHPLQPVWHEWSAQEDPQTLSQRACSTWTQDNKVLLALPNNPTQDSDLLRSCLGKAGVLSLAPMSYSRMLESSFKESPLWFEPETLSLETWARVYVKGLAAQGFFKGSKIGLIHDDSPTYAQVVRDVLVPEIRRAGADVVTGAANVRGTNELASGNAQMSSLVLRFRSEAVTNVMFFEPWVGWVLFAQNARSQGWKPTYGFSSQSIVWVAIQTGLVPTEQLVGAKAVSWNPGVDVPPDARGQWARQSLCLEIYEKAGLLAELRSSNNAFHKALTWCEGLMLFVDAGRAVSGAITPASLASALTSMGDFQLANTPRGRFTPDRHYGAAEWRPAAYDAGCTCLRYTGGASPI